MTPPTEIFRVYHKKTLVIMQNIMVVGDGPMKEKLIFRGGKKEEDKKEKITSITGYNTLKLHLFCL